MPPSFNRVGNAPRVGRGRGSELVNLSFVRDPTPFTGVVYGLMHQPIFQTFWCTSPKTTGTSPVG